MTQEDIDETIRKGIASAERGDFHTAQILLNDASAQRNTPELHSYLAYCLANTEDRMSAAAKTCRESIKREPANSLHYLILGRILLLAGQKDRAVKTFRQGLKTSPNPKIMAELKQLGLRKPPIFQSLGRDHFINRMCGRIFSTIGLR